MMAHGKKVHDGSEGYLIETTAAWPDHVEPMSIAKKRMDGRSSKWQVMDYMIHKTLMYGT
jgi:hypothetical protein